ncbi:MAG: galactose oxidase [Lysobacter sp.]|nr:galactose oxidase [Lysobacter sp.]MDQ3269571.1 galactose oxidase [Pseudomonadota bacterium]
MRKLAVQLAPLALLLLASCGDPQPAHGPAAGVPDMPEAISNNAVAAIEGAHGFRLYSFLGLKSGKTWRDTSREAFEFDSSTGRWAELPPVPVPSGRLASIATAVDGRLYLFGGYTVAENHEEVSTPEVLRFDSQTRAYTRVADMPLPVDDSVALVYRDRWVLLVSGWHKNVNVAAVQVYDTLHDAWSQSTDWPGTPVFGHSGAISGEHLLVCDGVRLDVGSDGKRKFSSSGECWRGQIHGGDPSTVQWHATKPHPGMPRYRMGAAALPGEHRALFAGGSVNPYNYDGMGYNDVPSEPHAGTLVFDFASGEWSQHDTPAEPTMDHRGLACTSRQCYLVGGMRKGQRVAASVVGLDVASLRGTERKP